MRLYKIIFENIFDFSVMEKFADLTEKQFLQALQSKRLKNVVISRLKPCKTRENYIIKDIFEI